MEINFKDLRVSANYPVYPPYHTGKYLEEYFYDFYIQNKEVFDKTNRTLIPVFWTNIYNTGINRHILQHYLNALPSSKKYFTVSQHDDAVVEQLPKNTIQFAAGGRGVSQIPIPLICSPIPKDYIVNTIEKNILCSFVGTLTNELRNQLYTHLQNEKDFYFTEKKNWSPIVPEDLLNEFIEITQRSWFTLCPRGYGLQSFRFYEALQLKSIPVFVYDTDWFPFNDIIDWSTFCICIHKNDIQKIPSIINNIPINVRYKMIETGQEIYKKYFTLHGVCEQILNKLINLCD